MKNGKGTCMVTDNNIYIVPPPTVLVYRTVKVPPGCEEFDELKDARAFHEYRAELAEKAVLMRHLADPRGTPHAIVAQPTVCWHDTR